MMFFNQSSQTRITDSFPQRPDQREIYGCQESYERAETQRQQSSFVVAVTMRSPTAQQQNRGTGAQNDRDPAQSQKQVPASSQAPQQIPQIISVCIDQCLL